MHRLLIPSLLALTLSACLSAKDVSPRESEPQDGKAASASSRNEEPGMGYRPMDFNADDGEFASDFAPDLSLARQSGYDYAAKTSPSTPPTDPNESQSSKEPEAPQQRLVIYTALLRLAVDILQDVFRQAELITTKLGGDVQSSTMQQRVLRSP
ncbi:MAG: hypothetical protein RBU37_27095, partial [Myxococcota bacterium]|nr:hypothetical protein [Myxococcota bacterium]